jgi:hypothetical protein
MSSGDRDSQQLSVRTANNLDSNVRDLINDQTIQNLFKRVGLM